MKVNERRTVVGVDWPLRVPPNRGERSTRMLCSLLLNAFFQTRSHRHHWMSIISSQHSPSPLGYKFGDKAFRKETRKGDTRKREKGRKEKGGRWTCCKGSGEGIDARRLHRSTVLVYQQSISTDAARQTVLVALPISHEYLRNFCRVRVTWGGGTHTPTLYRTHPPFFWRTAEKNCSDFPSTYFAAVVRNLDF